jgi:hypothetical protein
MDLTSTLLQTLMATGAMLIVALVVLLIYTRAPRHKSAESDGDRNEPYLGGEKEPYDEQSFSSGNLFWSIINQSLKNVFKKVVDRFYTYSIDEWMVYMSVWLAFLIILLIILVVVL